MASISRCKFNFMPPVWNLQAPAHKALYRRLKALAYIFADRPHQSFLARGPGVVVNAYLSGSIVLGGSNGAAMWEVEAILAELGATKAKNYRPPPDPLTISGTRIGTDESGKGDYFGPLVVAGVVMRGEQEGPLRALGVRDSKELTDAKIFSLAPAIRELVGRPGFEELVIAPKEYNRLYDPAQGIGALLGWAHAQVIENLLGRGFLIPVAVADQFGDDRHIKRHLGEQGRKVRLLQTPKGEREIAVAAASVLARARFLEAMARMGEGFGMEFPKGGDATEAGAEFVRRFGVERLGETAKLHFAVTERARRRSQAHGEPQDFGK